MLASLDPTAPSTHHHDTDVSCWDGNGSPLSSRAESCRARLAPPRHASPRKCGCTAHSEQNRRACTSPVREVDVLLMCIAESARRVTYVFTLRCTCCTPAARGPLGEGAHGQGNGIARWKSGVFRISQSSEGAHTPTAPHHGRSAPIPLPSRSVAAREDAVNCLYIPPPPFPFILPSISSVFFSFCPSEFTSRPTLNCAPRLNSFLYARRTVILGNEKAAWPGRLILLVY